MSPALQSLLNLASRFTSFNMTLVRGLYPLDVVETPNPHRRKRLVSYTETWTRRPFFDNYAGFITGVVTDLEFNKLSITFTQTTYRDCGVLKLRRDLRLFVQVDDDDWTYEFPLNVESKTAVTDVADGFWHSPFAVLHPVAMVIVSFGMLFLEGPTKSVENGDLYTLAFVFQPHVPMRIEAKMTGWFC